jgi:hypothetical protein
LEISKINAQFAYDVMETQWTSWIGSAAAEEADTNFGSYSVLTPQGLRIISVNTNFWYKVLGSDLSLFLKKVAANDCIAKLLAL